MADRKTDKRGLGRGLSALMADVAQNGNEGRPDSQRIAIEQIIPNPDQPRRDFDPDALNDLADSIRSRGILQPLIVRTHPDGGGLYQIVAGERRWRAAQIAQLHDLPVVIRDFSDTEMLEIALIENIQRADLNAVEEAASYRQLMERFGHTQEKLAEALNKSRSHISNVLRLLNLPEPVQAMLRDNRLSAGHARALITAPDPVATARRVIDRGLSVRDTERLVRDQLAPKTEAPQRKRAEKDADTRALESDLSAQLKMSVRINHAGQDGGQVVVSYRDLDQLDRLCQLLGG